MSENDNFPCVSSPQDSMQLSTFSYIISQMPLNMVTERYRTPELSTTKVFRTVRLFLATRASD